MSSLGGETHAVIMHVGVTKKGHLLRCLYSLLKNKQKQNKTKTKNKKTNKKQNKTNKQTKKTRTNKLQQDTLSKCQKTVSSSFWDINFDSHFSSKYLCVFTLFQIHTAMAKLIASFDELHGNLADCIGLKETESLADLMDGRLFYVTLYLLQNCTDKDIKGNECDLIMRYCYFSYIYFFLLKFWYFVYKLISKARNEKYIQTNKYTVRYINAALCKIMGHTHFIILAIITHVATSKTIPFILLYGRLKPRIYLQIGQLLTHGGCSHAFWTLYIFYHWVLPLTLALTPPGVLRFGLDGQRGFC